MYLKPLGHLSKIKNTKKIQDFLNLHPTIKRLLLNQLGLTFEALFYGNKIRETFSNLKNPVIKLKNLLTKLPKTKYNPKTCNYLCETDTIRTCDPHLRRVML